MKHYNPSSFNNYEKCESYNNVAKSREFEVTRDWDRIRERNMFSLFWGGGGHAYTGYTQNNGAVSKVNKKFISHLTRAQCTPSAAAATVQVSHALPAVRYSCLLGGLEASFQDGVTAGKDFLCVPFLGVQICERA